MKTYLVLKRKYKNESLNIVKGITLKQAYELLDYKAKGLYNGFIPRTYKEYNIIKKDLKAKGLI
jgi:hypothetical protein